MPIATATLSTIRTLMRYALRDANSGSYRFADSLLLIAINNGIKKINTDAPFLDRNAGIVTDGDQSIFTLVGNSANDVADDYYLIRNFKLYGSVITPSSLDDGSKGQSFDPEVVQWYGNDGTLHTATYNTGDQLSGWYIQDGSVIFSSAIPTSIERITDEDDRTFDVITNWVQTGGALVSLSGAGKYTYAAGTFSLSLASTAITAVTQARSMVFSCYIKKGTWGTGDAGKVTITIGNASKTITPTTSYQLVTLKYLARTTATTITITTDLANVAGATPDTLYIDTASLQECCLEADYYAFPQALAADTDAPESPLNTYDTLLMRAGLLSLMHAIDHDQLRGAYQAAEVAYQTELQNFKRDIASKGYNSHRTIKPNRF